jgi:hypothetical protein
MHDHEHPDLPPAAEAAGNNLYYCRVKVTRRPDSDIPAAYAGAYVPAFAAAADHQKALGLIIPTLQRAGWHFEEVEQNRVDEMEPEHWEAFLEATWPELKGELPDMAAIEALLRDGGCFYGPFSVWGAGEASEGP